MTVRRDNAAAPALAKGSEVELYLEKLALGGRALGRAAGLVVFVDHGVPGQRVRACIFRKKSQFAEARVTAVLEPSPVQATPRCRHFGLCGGCQWQDLDYGEQLRWKQLLVQECLEHVAGLRPENLKPAVASPEVFFYRNKMEFTFAPRPWVAAAELAEGRDPAGLGAALGLHVPGSFNRVFDLSECWLQSPRTGEIVSEVRRWVRGSGQPAYDTRSHTGFWRFLVLREGKATGQWLLHLITTAPGDQKLVDGLGARLRERFGEITTMVHSLSGKKAQVAQGSASRSLWGPGWIEEEMLGVRLRVSAQSFLQTNTRAAAQLYGAVLRLAELSGRETVWDLYCGAGSIALALAPRAQRVVGFELVAEAVRDAYDNCRRNGVDNCQFLAGDLKDGLREAMQSKHYPRPEVVITDPPRAGMHPQVVQALLELAPQRIIAVSCNPATLARDLALLQESYAIEEVEPHDLFPHTAHIECVVRLEKKTPAR